MDWGSTPAGRQIECSQEEREQEQGFQGRKEFLCGTPVLEGLISLDIERGGPTVKTPPSS
jgi:hypothetical protein